MAVCFKHGTDVAFDIAFAVVAFSIFSVAFDIAFAAVAFDIAADIKKKKITRPALNVAG